jgi:Transposase DDE domain.
MRFTTIEVADVNMAREVVQQAIDNIGNNAKIVSLAFDRGFIDGPFMWWLHKDMGIVFYVPAKKNMSVYKDALSLTSSGIREKRERERKVGKGKNSFTVIDQWDAVGIEGLTSAGFYGEKGSGSHENSNNFKPNPINAVVVLHDPYKENNPNSDTMVILTNGTVNEPLVTYDGYDARSEIENSLFREAKQAWFIQRPSENTIDSFRAHVYLTIMTMALTTAFRTWMEKQEKLDKQGKETGIRKFRETVRQENGNKFIVFDGERYAIFEAYEIVILCGRNVRSPRGVPEKIEKRTS